ncbi:hypothetical protein EJ08DRAFT_307972 [Tothia fuscella]|uniref:Uncharacterized protein n=1 Tax=Tothia fuscella TaxID=1048955 RepID=A0A9P4TWW3_9PEZI|nr:hypothetical protein EJ08DRAFT_307972 [Tothia fuscella]
MQDRMTRRNLTERKEAHIEHLEAKLRDLEASIDSAAPWNESHNVKRESLRDELQEYRKGLGFDNLSRLERIPITNSLHQPPSAKTTLGHNVGIAGHLYQAAFDLFALITSKVKAVRSISKTEQRELLRVFQSLALWGEDHNLTSGELDSVLQDSTQLQKVTVATLRSVVKIVSQEHEVAQVLAQSRFVDRGNEEHSDSNSSDEDSSDSDQSESLNTKSLQMILPNLQRLLRCLHDLSTSIDSFSEVRDREQPSFANTTLADIQPYQYYANSIRERFPAAEAALVEAFGKANLLRHHHLQQLQAMYSESSAPMLILGVEDVISKQARSENMDSGYGTMRTASAYAPTITSSRGSSLVELGQSTYPPLPEQAKRGEPFDCVACGRRIIAKRKQEWRYVTAS